MYRDSVENQGIQTTLTTGTSLSMSLRITAPSAGNSIHITRIVRSHHVSQSNDPVITLLSGTATPIWRTRSTTPFDQTYNFYHPIAVAPGTLAKIVMTSSLATHTLTALIHYFVEE